jgi:hypothetical protein
MFFYLGDPYYALLHKECAPFFSFTGMWPHAQPANYYTGRSQRVVPGKTPSPS